MEMGSPEKEDWQIKKKNPHFPNIGHGVNFGIKISELKSSAFWSFMKYEEWVPDNRWLKTEEWTSENQGEQFLCQGLKYALVS